MFWSLVIHLLLGLPVQGELAEYLMSRPNLFTLNFLPVFWPGGIIGSFAASKTVQSVAVAAISIPFYPLSTGFGVALWVVGGDHVRQHIVSTWLKGQAER